MLYVSIFLFLSVLLLLWFCNVHKTAAGVLFVPLTSVVVLSLLYWVADYFTGAGIDESVIFHLRVGLEGAGFKEYTLLMMSVVLLSGGWVAGFILLLRRCWSRDGRRSVVLSGAVLSLLAVAANPASHDLYRLYAPQPGRAMTTPGAGVASHYINRPKVTRTAEPPANLVYIYAESLEETYFDENLFPGLLPNLKALREQGLVFEDVSQVSNSGWTIAGMVASQCGLPLFMSGGGNSLSGMTDFMAGATCMGDILRQQGYFLSYMGGASTQFAGKGNFYRSHGFHKVQGLEELQDKQIDSAYQSSWGIYDDELFEFAREELAALQQKDSPFGLFLLTLDTHHPRGHLSKSCQGLKYPHQDNPMLDAVHCADRILATFIRDIQRQGLTDNTLIVLGSDHLAMKNTAYDQLQQGQRKNLLVMFPPGAESGKRIPTPASTLDIGATALALMGFELDGIGLGRNILAQQPTLMAVMEDFEHKLGASRSHFKHVWKYPALGRGIRLGDEGEVTLGAAVYRYPLLALVDENKTVQDVFFDVETDTSNAQRMATLPLGQRYIWIDRCDVLSLLYSGQTYAQQDCIGVGRLGAKRYLLTPVEAGVNLNSKQLDRIYNAKRSVSAERAGRQLAELSAAYNSQPGAVVIPDLFVDQLEVLSKPGIQFGLSSVRYRVGQHRRQISGLGRGLNLVLLRQDGEAELIQRYDGCNEHATISDDMTLEAVMEKHPGEHLLLLVHDSAHCGESSWLNHLLAGSGLALGPGLGFRQSYVALIMGRNLNYELAGKPGKQLKVSATRS